MGVIENRVRAKIDEFLRESFSKHNTLLNKLKWEIIELEYGVNEDMIQELIDGMQGRLDALETELVIKEERILKLEADKISIQEDLNAKGELIAQLELDKLALEERIEALEPNEEEPPI